MRGRLLAPLFALTVWAAFPQPAPTPSDTTARISAAVPAEAETQADVPAGGGGPDRQWIASAGRLVAGTESTWKTSIAHAGLTASPSRDGFVDPAAVRPSRRAAQNRLPHLRHVPLLI